MAKIDDYAKVEELTESDIIYLVQNGQDGHVTLEQIKAFVLKGGVLTSDELKALISEEIVINEPKW